MKRLDAKAHGRIAATPKRLPPRLFYDADGSALFEEITRLPEYYLTRTEEALLERHAHAVGEDRSLERDRLKLALGNGEQRRIGRMQMRHRERVRARGVERSMDRPFHRRADRAFNRFAAQVAGDHILGAEAALLRAHTGCDEYPFRFGLIDAHMSKNSDHSLHREDTGAGGQLAAQFEFSCHRLLSSEPPRIPSYEKYL